MLYQCTGPRPRQTGISVPVYPILTTLVYMFLASRLSMTAIKLMSPNHSTARELASILRNRSCQKETCTWT
ncbi:hypothetical protein C5167_048574 [Papaver somniferum]|uniref:Uncharacterized protein n=1 Tax=Papaver somniferum TaxID=3469 RepID=A0A4Y7KL26_PAPSO|nr:hypothetical protein C5167_048574 [Papaver somniferum]